MSVFPLYTVGFQLVHVSLVGLHKCLLSLVEFRSMAPETLTRILPLPFVCCVAEGKSLLRASVSSSVKWGQ